MREPTTLAMEESLVPVRLIYKPASTASQACESWVNQDYSFPHVFSLVSEELPELVVSPVATHPVELSSFSPVSDIFKLFHSEETERFLNYSLTEAVVEISHEPSLPSRKSFEFSLSGTGAYGLELLPQISIPSLDTSDFVRSNNSVIRTNSKIIDSQIYSKNFFVFALSNDSIFNNSFDSANLSMNTDNNTLNLPGKIFVKIFRDINRILLSAFNSCKLYLSALKKYFGSSQVKPNATKQTFDSFLFISVPFEHFYCIVSRTLDESRREVGKLFSNFSIQGFMQSILGIGLELKKFIDMKIRNGIILFNCFKNFIPYGKIQTNYSLHNLLTAFIVIYFIAIHPPYK